MFALHRSREWRTSFVSHKESCEGNYRGKILISLGSSEKREGEKKCTEKWVTQFWEGLKIEFYCLNTSVTHCRHNRAFIFQLICLNRCDKKDTLVKRSLSRQLSSGWRWRVRGRGLQRCWGCVTLLMTTFRALWLAGFRFGLFVFQHVVSFVLFWWLLTLIIGLYKRKGKFGRIWKVVKSGHVSWSSSMIEFFQRFYCLYQVTHF